MASLDEQIRLAAFEWIKSESDFNDGILDRDTLRRGFTYKNERIPLVSPQGIFKPKSMNLPLTITTTTNGPYNDLEEETGLFNYKYRGTDPNHKDNLGLRECMRRKIPLIYLISEVPGKYFAIYPVYIVYDDPISLSFKVAAYNYESVQVENNRVFESDSKNAYIATTIKIRLHQKMFRERVLYAYQTQCTVCKLKHAELLDAAHIIPDGEPQSKPTVDNGLSLCKLHHAAFDRLIIGITPDYNIEIRKDILDEIDGPMLQHGLKGLHNHKIILPNHKKDWPNKDFLDIRYQRYKSFL